MRVEKDEGELFTLSFNIFKAGTYELKAVGSFPGSSDFEKVHVKKFEPGRYTLKLRSRVAPQLIILERER